MMQVADLNAVSPEDKWTALHFAANEGHTEIVKDLIDRNGIEIDSLTNQQRTALHIAAARGHTEICKLFIEKQVPKIQM